MKVVKTYDDFISASVSKPLSTYPQDFVIVGRISVNKICSKITSSWQVTSQHKRIPCPLDPKQWVMEHCICECALCWPNITVCIFLFLLLFLGTLLEVSSWSCPYTSFLHSHPPTLSFSNIPIFYFSYFWGDCHLTPTSFILPTLVSFSCISVSPILS